MEFRLGKAESISDRGVRDRIRERLEYLAWRKHLIRSEDAERIIRKALARFDAALDGDRPPESQYGLLIGLFNDECRELLGRRARELRRVRGLARSRGADAN